jgi:hypothetical protein
MSPDAPVLASDSCLSCVSMPMPARSPLTCTQRSAISAVRCVRFISASILPASTEAAERERQGGSAWVSNPAGAAAAAAAYARGGHIEPRDAPMIACDAPPIAHSVAMGILDRAVPPEADLTGGSAGRPAAACCLLAGQFEIHQRLSVSGQAGLFLALSRGVGEGAALSHGAAEHVRGAVHDATSAAVDGLVACGRAGPQAVTMRATAIHGHCTHIVTLQAAHIARDGATAKSGGSEGAEICQRGDVTVHPRALEVQASQAPERGQCVNISRHPSAAAQP